MGTADSLTLFPLGPTGPSGPAGPGSPFRPWEQKRKILKYKSCQWERWVAPFFPNICVITRVAMSISSSCKKFSCLSQSISGIRANDLARTPNVIPPNLWANDLGGGGTAPPCGSSGQSQVSSQVVKCKRRTAVIKSDSWQMRPDAYRQPEFAAIPVRCDTFGPVATPLWELVWKMTAGVVRKMTRKRDDSLWLNLDSEKLLIANHTSAEDD